VETIAPERPAAPAVVAVIVCHDPGTWFEQALRAVAALDYPNVAVLVLDAASEVDPTPRVQAACPGAHVERLSENRGYGAAANRVGEVVEGAAFYLFLHDDAAPTQTQQRALHPLIAIGIFIVVFLEIHPFQDGNGRLSRVLTTLLLLRAGYAYVPYSSLERFIEQSVIEQSKEGYYLALRRTQGTIRTEPPDWTPWLTFFLTALHRQMRRLREKVERERLLLAKLPELAVQILDHARDHGRVTIADAVVITGASRNTLKLHFKTLRERGLLALHGQGRGAWYSLP
jgi:hypothetical protein